MRIFHEMVLEAFIEGATGFLPPSQGLHWWSVMGHFETFRVIVIADHVSGDSPTLGIDLWETAELETVQKNPIMNIAGGALTAGQTNILQGSFTPADALPATHAYLLYCALAGGPTPPVAHVRIWVTGRGRA